MLNIHQKFCRETFYDGKLVDFKPVYQDNFNFAYDVIDVIAQAEPERRADVYKRQVLLSGLLRRKHLSVSDSWVLQRLQLTLR